jgi:MoxR-like ATPase
VGEQAARLLIMNTEEQIASFRGAYEALRAEIGKVIVGHHEIVEGTLIAIFGGGHVLLEGVPGLGKTLLVRTLSEVLDMSFNRIQFTPDLMPADILGTNIVMESPGGRREFEFQHGPIFAHLVLADEINRATPKTQSAMLEAMQEKKRHRRGRNSQAGRAVLRARHAESHRPGGDVSAA